ncbi:Lipoyl ligase [Datura stramonium]|uniref:Lipoyl ligase n=1 Tax=Datura stramonium TaxID=4076 RepID=A0ABS8SWC3_DATST|nr:Lipoyl ligase [Datura stramonium]
MGTVNYLEALKLQEKLASDRKALKVSETLLSLQHPPTYSVGKRQTAHNLLIPDSALKAIGAELHYTQKGGDITFHGPHQAILYPIISLRDITLGARNSFHSLPTYVAGVNIPVTYEVMGCPSAYNAIVVVDMVVMRKEF